MRLCWLICLKFSVLYSVAALACLGSMGKGGPATVRVRGKQPPLDAKSKKEKKKDKKGTKRAKEEKPAAARPAKPEKKSKPSKEACEALVSRPARISASEEKIRRAARSESGVKTPTGSQQAHVQALMDVKEKAAANGMSVDQYLNTESKAGLDGRLKRARVQEPDEARMQV